MKSHGAWLIDKPAGITSFGVIDQLKRALSRAYGVRFRDLPALGHGGTLDPFATGLLVVFVGRATRLAQCYLGGAKTYTGTMRFGATTISGDCTDPELPDPAPIPASEAEIQEMAAEWVGAPYEQLPPMHSAKRVQGQRLYDLARQGVEIERPAKSVRISAFEITSYQAPDATFRVTASSGTYIRVLAQDCGKRLGSLAYLTELRRVETGGFVLAQCVTLDHLLQAIDAVNPLNSTLNSPLNSMMSSPSPAPALSTLPGFVPWDELLRHTLQVDVTTEEASDLLQGRQRALFSLARRVVGGPVMKLTELSYPAGPSKDDETPWVALRAQGHLFGLARQIHGRLQLERLFPKS